MLTPIIVACLSIILLIGACYMISVRSHRTKQRKVKQSIIEENKSIDNIKNSVLYLTLSKENADLKKINIELSNENIKLKKELGTDLMIRLKTTRENIALKDTNTKLNSDISHLHSFNIKSANYNTSLENENKLLKQANEQLNKQLSDIENTLNDLQNITSSWDPTYITSLENENKLLKQANEQLNQAYTQIIMSNTPQLEKENNQLKLQINKLKALNDELTDAVKKYAASNLNIEENFKQVIANSDEWNDKYLATVEKSKLLKKNKAAAVCNLSWTVNGSHKLGNRMIQDSIKLCVSIFDIFVDRACNYVTPTNYTTIKEKIVRQYEKINTLNEINKIYITKEYLESKLSELLLIKCYKEAKEQEREKSKEIRRLAAEQKKEAEQLAEEEKQLQQKLDAQKKFDEEKAKAIEDQLKENQELLKINADNEEKINTLTQNIQRLEQQLEALKAENAKSEEELIEEIVTVQTKQEVLQAGYIYVISNIGAFGENVFKIGVTRRIDPLERINELGNASVPFKFNVHAIIPSEEAFKLENTIHKELRPYRVNLVNRHKEFFKINIDELHKKLSELVENLEFNNNITEEQYLQTIDIRNNPEKFEQWLQSFTENKSKDDLEQQMRAYGIIRVTDDILNRNNYIITDMYDYYYNLVADLLASYNYTVYRVIAKYYFSIYLRVEDNAKRLMTFYKTGDGKSIFGVNIYNYEGPDVYGARKTVRIEQFYIEKYEDIIVKTAADLETQLLEFSSLNI